MSDPLLSPVDNEISSSSDADLISKVNKKELPALGKTRCSNLNEDIYA